MADPTPTIDIYTGVKSIVDWRNLIRTDLEDTESEAKLLIIEPLDAVINGTSFTTSNPNIEAYADILHKVREDGVEGTDDRVNKVTFREDRTEGEAKDLVYKSKKDEEIDTLEQAKQEAEKNAEAKAAELTAAGDELAKAKAAAARADADAKAELARVTGVKDADATRAVAEAKAKAETIVAEARADAERAAAKAEAADAQAKAEAEKRREEADARTAAEERVTAAEAAAREAARRAADATARADAAEAAKTAATGRADAAERRAADAALAATSSDAAARKAVEAATGRAVEAERRADTAEAERAAAAERAAKAEAERAAAAERAAKAEAATRDAAEATAAAVAKAEAALAEAKAAAEAALAEAKREADAATRRAAEAEAQVVATLAAKTEADAVLAAAKGELAEAKAALAEARAAEAAAKAELATAEAALQQLAAAEAAKQPATEAKATAAVEAVTAAKKATEEPAKTAAIKSAEKAIKSAEEAIEAAKAKATADAEAAKAEAGTDEVKKNKAKIFKKLVDAELANANVIVLNANLDLVKAQLKAENEKVATLQGEIETLKKTNEDLNANNAKIVQETTAKSAQQINDRDALIHELQARLGYTAAISTTPENVKDRLTKLLKEPADSLDELIKNKSGEDQKLLQLLQFFMDTNNLKMTDEESKQAILNKFNDILIGNILDDKQVSLKYYLENLILDPIDPKTQGELKGYFTLKRSEKDKLGSEDQKENQALDAVESLVGDRVSFYKERSKNPLDYQYVKDQLKEIEHDYNEAKRLKAEPIQAISRLLSIIPPQSLGIFLQELAATERNEDDLRKIGSLIESSRVARPANAAGGGQSGGNINEIFNSAILKLAERYKALEAQINGMILLTKPEADNLTDSIATLETISTKIGPFVTSLRGGGDYRKDIYDALYNSHENIENKIKNLGKVGNIGKLEAIKTNLNRINTGGMRGGVEPVELPKDQATLTKEKVKELDDMKKTVRELINNVIGYKNRFIKFYDNVNEQEKQLTPDELKNRADEAKTDPEKAAAKAEAATAADVTTKQYTVASGLYQYLQDEGKNLNTDIQSKITTDKKALQDVVTKLNALLDKEPTTVKLFRDARFDIRRYLTGVQPDGKEDPDKGLETLYPKIVGIIKGYYEEKYAKIKTKAEGLKKQREYELETKRAEQKGILALQPSRGGASETTGEGNEKNVIEVTVKTITENLNGILTNILVPISQQYTKRLNPTLLAVTSASPPTLFQTLYNRYLDEVTDDPYRATERLSESLRTNHLVPKEVLEVTRNDRLIFMFTTLIIRLFGVNLSNWMIDKGYITTLRGAFISYLALYTVLILLFVAIVNLDLYRMRIIFNYVNLHANRARVATHLVAFWIFAFFIYLYFAAISKLNKTSPFTSDAPYSLTEEDKARLQYKVQLLSIILWFLLVILIALI